MSELRGIPDQKSRLEKDLLKSELWKFLAVNQQDIHRENTYQMFGNHGQLDEIGVEYANIIGDNSRLTGHFMNK